MVYSLSRVVQDLYHPPYQSLSSLQEGDACGRQDAGQTGPWMPEFGLGMKVLQGFRNLGIRVGGWGRGARNCSKVFSLGLKGLAV